MLPLVSSSVDMVCWVLPHSLLPLVFSPTFINIQDAVVMHSLSQWSFYLDKASICQHPLSLGTPGWSVMTGVMKSVTVTRNMNRLRIMTTDCRVTRGVMTVIGQILQPIEQHFGAAISAAELAAVYQGGRLAGLRPDPDV